MEVRPASPGTGYVFVLSDGARIPALAEYAIETPLATVIQSHGRSISTIEHVLSALIGMGVSDAEIELDGREIPILDGRAKIYADAIAGVGLETSSRERPVLRLNGPFECAERRQSRDRPAVGRLSRAVRRATTTNRSARTISTARSPREPSATEIAPARTFTFLRDVEAMRAQGLARGGSLDNALVYDENGPDAAVAMGKRSRPS